MSSVMESLQDTFGWRLWASIWSDLLPSSVCLTLFLVPRCREWLGPFSFLVWANSFLYLLIPVDGGSMLVLQSGLSLLGSMLLAAGVGVLGAIACRYNAVGLVVWLSALIFVRLLARGPRESQSPLAAFANITPAYAFLLMATANYNPMVTLNYLGHSMARAAFITWIVHLLCRFLFGYTQSTNAIMREHMSDVLEGLADMLRSTARLLVDSLDEQAWHVPASLTHSNSEPYDVEIKQRVPLVDNRGNKDMLHSTEIAPEQDLYRTAPKATDLSSASSVELANRAGMLRQLRFTLREAVVDMPKLERSTKWSCRLMLNGQYGVYHHLAKVLTEACWLVLEVCVYHPKNNTEPLSAPPPMPFLRQRPGRRSPPRHKDPEVMVSQSQAPPEFVKMWGSQREVVVPPEISAADEAAADDLTSSRGNGSHDRNGRNQDVAAAGTGPRGVDSFPVEDDVPFKATGAAVDEDEDDDTPMARTAPTPVAESWEFDREGNIFHVWFNHVFRSSQPKTPIDFRVDPVPSSQGRPIAEGEEDIKPDATTTPTPTPEQPTRAADTAPTAPADSPTTVQAETEVVAAAVAPASEPAPTTTSATDAPTRDKPSVPTEDKPEVPKMDEPSASTSVSSPSAVSSPVAAVTTSPVGTPAATSVLTDPPSAVPSTPTAAAATSTFKDSTPEGGVPKSPEELSPSGVPDRRPGRILEAVERALKRPDDSYPPGYKPPPVDVASDQGTPSVGTPKPPTPTFELKPTPSPALTSPDSAKGVDAGSVAGESPTAPPVVERTPSGKWGRADSGKSSAFGKLAAKLRSGLVGRRSSKGSKEDNTLQEVKVQEEPVSAEQAGGQMSPEGPEPERVENMYEPAGQSAPAPNPYEPKTVEAGPELGVQEQQRRLAPIAVRPSAIPLAPELPKKMPSKDDEKEGVVDEEEEVEEEEEEEVADAVPKGGSMEIPMSQEMYKSVPAVNPYDPVKPQQPLPEAPSPMRMEYPEPSASPMKPIPRVYDDTSIERNEVPRSSAASAVAGMATRSAAAMAGKKDKRGKKGKRRDFPSVELAALDEDSPVDAELPEMDQMRLKGRAVEGAAKTRKSRLANKVPPSFGKHDLKTCVATFADEVACALDIMSALVAPVPLAGHLPPSLVDFLGPEWKLHPRQHPRRVNAMAFPMPDIEHGSLSPATKQLVSQVVPGKSAHVEMVLTLRPLLKAQMQVAEKAYQRFEQQLLQALHKAGGPLKAAQSSNSEQALNVMYFFSFSRYMLNTFYPLGDAVRDFTAATCTRWSPSLEDWLHEPSAEEVIPPEWKHNTPQKSVFSQFTHRLHLRSFRRTLADLRETLRMTLLVTVIAAIGFGVLLGWGLPHPLYGFGGLVFVSIVMAMPWSVTGVLMAVVYMFAAWMGVLVAMIVWATSSGDKYVGGTAAWFILTLAFLSFIARALPDAATACAMGGLFIAIPVAGYMNSMPVGGPRMEEALGGWYGAPKTGFYRFAALNLATLLIAALIAVLTQIFIFPRLASRKIKDVEAIGSKELLVLCTSQQLIDNELRERCHTGEFQTPAEVQEAGHVHQRGMWHLHGNFMAQLVQYNRLVQSAWQEPAFYGAFNAGLHRDLNMYMSKASNASMALCVMLLRPLLTVASKEQTDDPMLQGFQKEVVAHPLMNGDLQRASIQLLQSVNDSLQTRGPVLLPAMAPSLKFHLSRQTQGLRDAVAQLSTHARHPISVSNWNEALGRVWIEMLLLLHLNSSVELNKAIRGAARACRELNGYLLPPPPTLLPSIPTASAHALYSGEQLQIVTTASPDVRTATRGDMRGSFRSDVQT